MATARDRTCQLDSVPPAARRCEIWEHNTYVTCEVLGWRGIWLFEERRRIGNVDVGRTIYLGLRYYGRCWKPKRTRITSTPTRVPPTQERAGCSVTTLALLGRAPCQIQRR